MSIQAAIRAELAGTAAVTALVSSDIYGSFAPNDAGFPRIMMQQVSGGSIHHLTAATSGGESMMQIASWGTSLDSAHAVAEQVRIALAGKLGTIGTGGNTAVLQSCIHQGRFEVEEDPQAGENQRRAVGFIDEFSIIYTQPTS